MVSFWYTIVQKLSIIKPCIMTSFVYHVVVKIKFTVPNKLGFCISMLAKAHRLLSTSPQTASNARLL